MRPLTTTIKEGKQLIILKLNAFITTKYQQFGYFWTIRIDDKSLSYIVACQGVCCTLKTSQKLDEPDLHNLCDGIGHT